MDACFVARVLDVRDLAVRVLAISRLFGDDVRDPSALPLGGVTAAPLYFWPKWPFLKTPYMRHMVVLDLHTLVRDPSALPLGGNRRS